MENVIIAISIVWTVFCILLAFKIWGACNAIQRLADKYAPEIESEEIEKRNSTKNSVKNSGRIESKDAIEKWLNEDVD